MWTLLSRKVGFPASSQLTPTATSSISDTTIRTLLTRPAKANASLHRAFSSGSPPGTPDPWAPFRGNPQTCRVHPPAPLGQPHALTHPHLMDVGQVNPGIYKEEFALRRHRLAENVLNSNAAFKSNGGNQRKPNNTSLAKFQSHIVIIPAAKRSFMIEKIPYFFRQDTDFRYLTGCMEPDCVLLLEVSKDAEKSTLFVRDPNTREEKWEGVRTRPGQDAREFFGVDRVVAFSHLEENLKRFRDANSEFLLWYDYQNPKSSDVHTVVMDFIRNLASSQNIESPRNLIHQLRVIKTPAEIALIRQSCRIAAESISETIRLSKHLHTEAQVFATVDYQCRMKGAQFLAYPPVVACGDNANVIHYTHCNQELQKDQLILMDAGCELHGYTSDITRTWPTSGGPFTSAQKVIYEIVIDIQTKLLEEIRNRRPSLDELYNSMQKHLAASLRREKILLRKDEPSELEMTVKASELCPHHVSHYLGMDVHDTALISRAIPLQKGMVVTVEPGVYIPAGNAEVCKEFRGIGVRIEDDILVTERGCDVLSELCPRTVEDLEKLCRE